MSDRVRVACADHVNRALWRSTLTGIPSSFLLALILGDTVPLSRRIAFVLLVSGADILLFLASGRYLARRKRGEIIAPHWLCPFSTALIGAAWGSLAVIGLPDAHHVDLRAMYMLFVCGTSATYVVGAAARRLYFYASQLPLVGLPMIVFLQSSDRPTRLLGFAVPIYFVVMTSLHHDVHNVVISELSLRESNDLASSQLRDANVLLTHQAMRDGLTSLANRAAFVSRLERAVSAARQSRATIGVVYFDLDRFKVVNDSLGHSAGDELLVSIATRVQVALRTNDLLARLGGDEFTILLDPLRDDAEAVAVAERVARSFEAPFLIGGRQLNITASIGVATNLNFTDDAEALLSQADAAQYRAKQGGRNRIEVFDIELRAAIQRRLDDENELRSAISGGDITAWYQPEIELATGRIAGAEALARWVHPQRGVLDAGHFVPLAEESGLVIRLDNLTVTKAVEARAALAAAAGADDTFRVWCNVSPNQFLRGAPAERLATLLDRTGCDPNHIGIEITESAIVSDVSAAAREINAARDLGIKVALDDFGTGHSSLTLLRSLPIDKVKIDRTFVSEVTRDARDASIVRAVITLANDLGLDVTAEGVETAEQAEVLAQLGCRYAQGYLWARALPLDEISRQLRAQHLHAA